MARVERGLVSSREVVGASGASIAVAAATPAFAPAWQTSGAAPALENPGVKYPKPPFKAPIAALAGSCEPDGREARSRGKDLSRLGAER